MPTNPTDEQRAKFEARVRLVADVLAIGMFKRHPIYSREMPPQEFSETFHRNFGTWEAAEEVVTALAAQEGGGGDEYQSAITQDQVDRARNAFFKKMMLGFGVDDCFFAALHAAQEGTSNG